MEGERCVQIQAPHFTAGLVIQQGRVGEAAPIMGYMKGWYWSEVLHYCERKHWTVRYVDDLTSPEAP